MNWDLTSIAILAQQSRLRAMASEFRGERAKVQMGDLLSIALLVGGTALLIWLFARFASRPQRPRSCNKPGLLFRNLCQAHGLSRSEQSVLRQMGRCYGLDQPAHLFLEPHRFIAHELPAALRESASEVERLREKLFAVSEAA